MVGALHRYGALDRNRLASAEFPVWFLGHDQLDHRGGVERACGERCEPEPDRGCDFAIGDPRRQVRHRYLDDEIDANLNDKRNRAPDQAVHDIGGVGDGADQRQHETEQAEAERNRGRRVVVADQLEFIVRRDPGIDKEVGDDGDKGGAEVNQERR